MRTLLITCALLLSAICLMTSCQKEVDWSQPATAQADSGFLSRMISLDTTRPAGSDTISKFFFYYDGQKRLASIFNYNVGTQDTIRHTFSYNGNDSLPSQHIVDQQSVVGPSVFTYKNIIYFTTSANMIVKDSTITIVNGTILRANVSRYAVNGTTAEQYNAEYDYIGGNYVLNNRDTNIHSILVTANNLVKQTITSGTTNSYDLVQATYDTKLNPLNRIYKVRYPLFENPYFEMWLLQRNNPLAIQYQEQGFPTTYNETYTYKYRADGYPVSWTYFSDRGPGLYNKMLYYYTTL